MPQLFAFPKPVAGPQQPLPVESPNRPIGQNWLDDAVDVILGGLGIENPMSPQASRATQVGGMVGAAVPVLGMAAKGVKAAQGLNRAALEQWTEATRAKYPDLGALDVHLTAPGDLRLNTIAVPNGGRGVGTAVMNDLAALADDHGKRLVLSLAEKGFEPVKGAVTSSPSRLEAFYKRFGFVPNTGRNKDFALSESMYRPPQAKAVAEPVAAAQDYRGTHTAPGREGGAPLHDLTHNIYPDDVYSPNGQRYYGDSSPADRKTFQVVQQMRGKPNAEVTVYRAMPKGEQPAINRGDWVTVNRDYAKQHGQSALGGDYQIVSKKVKAQDIFTNGDSIHEWGFDPIDILKKYGIALPFAGAAAALTQPVLHSK